MKYKGFTLVEVLMVVVIAGILLAMTFNLGWDYINFLKYKQDRENLVNILDTAIITSRTTNYYNNIKYTYMDVNFMTTGVNITYGTGDASDTATCADEDNPVFATYSLTRAILSGFAKDTVRILPFQVSCYELTSGEGKCSEISTGLDLSVQSLISDHETCYSFDLSVCKFNQIACP